MNDGLVKESLMIFGHNDLDMLGCMLNIEQKMPNVPKEYFYTNYANIDKLVKEIKEFAKITGSKHLLIVDVSFSDNKPALQELYDMGLKITHIDHHLYPDGFWNCFPDMKVHWDKSKSASLLCNEYFNLQGVNSNLDKLTTLIDVYDLWQTDHPAFEATQDLNEYFWCKVRTMGLGLEKLMDEIIAAGWTLPSDYTEIVQDIKEQYTADIASYETRKLIHRAGEITLCFVPDWFNHILIKEMKNGKNFVIGINQYGIVRVRINKDAPYTSEMKDSLRMVLTGTKNIGHDLAFTYKIKDPVNFDTIMTEAKKVTDSIERYCI